MRLQMTASATLAGRWHDIIHGLPRGVRSVALGGGRDAWRLGT